MKVPKQILDKAARLGVKPEYVGTDNGAQVYNASAGGADTPTGLPVFLLFKDGKVTEVTGLDALDLLSRLSES